MIMSIQLFLLYCCWNLLNLNLNLNIAGIVVVEGYQRKPCTRAVAAQFQFDDCFLPNMNPSLLLSEASFVMSHDAATGYLDSTQGISGATNLYAKNQLGSVYEQLNDGSRALDIRPKLLSNGTVICHHGSINVATITLEDLVKDAIRWCNDNPEELVLIDHANFAYENATITGSSDDITVTSLSQVYNRLGVIYVQCSDLYGLTVGETMELSALEGGGYLLAMDHHDISASGCAKGNWIPDQIVTCYPTNNNNTMPCTKPNSPVLYDLKEYVLASANNDPTDSRYELGPPQSLDYYPFNKIQALWQVDTASAALGIAHLSTIIDDNTKSRLNAHVVDWIYDENFNSISLLMVDHIQLNGNAILSVVRNACGQSELSAAAAAAASGGDDDDNDGQNDGNDNDDDDSLSSSNNDAVCGRMIPKPKLQQKPMTTLSFFVSIIFYGGFLLWLAVMLRHYRKYYNHDQQIERMKRDLTAAQISIEEQTKTTRLLCSGGGGELT